MWKEIIFKKYVNKISAVIIPIIFCLQQPHDLQGRNLSSCHDFINSTYSLAVIGMDKKESGLTSEEKYRRTPQNTTDEESPQYRSNSSFSNSDSFVSLISRKPSFAKSSNTLLERYGSIHEDFEEHDGDNENESELAILKKLKNRSLNSHDSGRRPSIKFLNEKANTRSTYSLGSIKCETEVENDSVSLSKFGETSTSTNSNNFLNFPTMERKPSITFSETVSIFRTGRRGSSPCKYTILPTNLNSVIKLEQLIFR